MMSQTGYGTSSNRVTRVQLYLYASKLKNVAGMFHGTSDPYCIVTRLANVPNDKPVVIGKTEVILNTLDPKWTTTFHLDYEFGVPLRLNVGVYDDTRKSKNNKPMGSALFEVGEILGAPGNTKAKSLKNGGTIFARVLKAHEVDSGTLNLSLRGIQLKNLDGMFGKSDPFYEISAQVYSAGGVTWQPVYRSAHVMNNLNPKWQQASISLNSLCQGDKNKPIMVTVKDWEHKGRHEYIGSFETTVNSLLSAQVGGGMGSAKNVDTSKAFSVLSTKGKVYGKIIVVEASVVGGTSVPQANHSYASSYTSGVAQGYGGAAPDFSQSLNATSPAMVGAAAGFAAVGVAGAAAYSQLPPPMAPPSGRPKFIDYISGGCELQMCVAIDFTGSNGDPRRPGTLHYIHRDGQLNDYEKAISAVGSIVARYDTDQKFPVWGFGAKFGGVVRHCFQVGPNAELHRIGGILDGYRNVFKSGLTMSGPTVFAEVIEVAAAQARNKQEAARRIGKQVYTVLLILTDGAVSDVNATKQAIVAASTAPLSIIIIGVGNEDFSAMQFLDDFADNRSRDACQFVEFSKYQHNKSALTRETLAEVPDQLVNYFESQGIKPLPPISGSTLSIAPDAYNDDEDIDLSIEQYDDGRVALTQTTGAVYDDTQYGTLADHMGQAGRPVGMAPTSTAPFVPTSSLHGTVMSAQPPVVAGGSFVASNAATVPVVVAGGSFVSNAPVVASQPYGYQPHGQPPQQYGVVAGAAAAPPGPQYFNVQVPPGVGPGMQLQVQNPATQQMMMVSIPHGVPPGGMFPVYY